MRWPLCRGVPPGLRCASGLSCVPEKCTALSCEFDSEVTLESSLNSPNIILSEAAVLVVRFETSEEGLPVLQGGNVHLDGTLVLDASQIEFDEKGYATVPLASGNITGQFAEVVFVNSDSCDEFITTPRS